MSRIHFVESIMASAECLQANVLIDSGLRARLADFGLAMVVDESATGSIIDNKGIRGTIRWMAPEMMLPEKFGFTGECQTRLPSRGTDIYSLGMTILEVGVYLWELRSSAEQSGDLLQVITGCHPFHNVAAEVAVMCRVLEGGQPDRPLSGFTDPLWELLTKTWVVEHGLQPAKRPPTSAILDRLNREVDNWGKSIVPPHLVESTVRTGYRAGGDGEFVFLSDESPRRHLGMRELTAIQQLLPASQLSSTRSIQAQAAALVLPGPWTLSGT